MSITLGDVKDFANIIFFIVGGGVAVLTYIHARTTVFAPLRTETFKLQLKAFEGILGHFQGKGEIEFQDDFDYQRILRLNVFEAMDVFVQSFFPEHVHELGDRTDMYEPLKTRILNPAELQEIRPFEKFDGPIKTERPTSPALILQRWKGYKVALGVSEKNDQAAAEIKKLSISPLLPASVRKSLDMFNEANRSNLMLIKKIVEESAGEMPDHFANFDSMKSVNIAWVWNKFNSQKTPLEPLAARVMTEIKNYLNIDALRIPSA